VSSLIRTLANLGLKLNPKWSGELSAIVRKLRAVPRIQLSAHLKSALVLGEDRRFWTHCGVDLISACRAFYRTFAAGKLEGASTVEQQLIRVISGRYERTASRKIREITLATSLSRHFSKEEILNLYLRAGYYGWRMSGLDQACETLSIDAVQADAGEAAALVARLKYPEPKHKTDRQAQRISRRTMHIIALMKDREQQNLTIGSNRPRKLLRSSLGG